LDELSEEETKIDAHKDSDLEEGAEPLGNNGKAIIR